MSGANPQCTARVWNGWSDSPCNNPGKEQQRGKWYCGVHAPSTIAKRKAKRQEKWDAEEARRKERLEATRRTPHTCRTCGLEHRP